MAFNIGDTVGDYQVIGILGAGGMGKVYKVRNVISDRIEAMKVLLPDLANEPELADRFMREIKLLASLNHPNIAALHTAQRYQNQLLMVMEFVEGRTLEQRLRESGRLSAREAVGCVSQALSALGYAHERGVVHRDIKPANMMEMADGAVKLMDFGIAKASADRRLTMTGTTLGSLYYMSPEQVRGSGNLDGRSDLYSVGVTLYELVTGTRPFKGDSDYSIMVAHLEQLPVPPVQIDPTVPPALSEIILTAIAKDPGQRFQTAEAFRAALESIRPVLPAAAAPAAAFGSAGTPTQPTGVPQAAWQPPPPAAQVVPPGPQMQPLQPAPQIPLPQPPPPAQARGHRGLWMALGALVAVAVLVGAAFQIPKFFGTKAETARRQPAPAQVQAVPSPQNPAREQAQEQTTPPAGQPPAAESRPAAQSQSQSAASEPPAPANPAGSAVAGSLPRPKPVRAGTALTAAQPSQPAPRSEPPAPLPQPPPPQASAPSQPAVDPAIMAELRDRFRVMSSRVNSVSRSLKTLESSQRASGLGLRGDISAAWDRLSDGMDEAKAAIQAGDSSAAKRALDTVEKDLDRIEKFLGR